MKRTPRYRAKRSRRQNFEAVYAAKLREAADWLLTEVFEGMNPVKIHLLYRELGDGKFEYDPDGIIRNAEMVIAWSSDEGAQCLYVSKPSGEIADDRIVLVEMESFEKHIEFLRGLVQAVKGR